MTVHGIVMKEGRGTSRVERESGMAIAESGQAVSGMEEAKGDRQALILRQQGKRRSAKAAA